MFRIAVDIGGTFTDAVIAHDDGTLFVGKSLTTPERSFKGISGALSEAARVMELDLRPILERSNLFVLGTTRSTNAVLERKTARTAFLTTAGFPDILTLREGGREQPFNLRIPYPAPYVPRRLTYEIEERVNAEGEIIQPLNEKQVRQVLRQLRRQEIQAVGVCLLWSIMNSKHEDRVGQLIEEELPNTAYTLSHRINPIIREYRRASTTVLDASLKPLIQEFLTNTEKDLREAGLSGDILIASSSGGMMHLQEMAERPIYTVRSGPAMSPVAGRHFYCSEIDTSGDGVLASSSLIVCDAGGTSFDVTLVPEGSIKFTRETVLGERFTDQITGLSSVDVRSIGAGGGSIAWLDTGGLLRVGPMSAGADPGPACYGRGGTKPTVTDAAVTLGYISADHFLGGRMRLDPVAARAAIEPVAEELAMSVDEAAYAIVAVATEAMIGAIKDITIKEGVDPRESLLVGGGGAAGLNLVPIARELGISTILVPRAAGTLSACGGQYSPIIHEASRSQLTFSNLFAHDVVNATLDSIESELRDFADRLQRRGVAHVAFEYFVEARYRFQFWELEIALPTRRFRNEDDVSALVASFHAAHERTFAVSEPGQEVECVLWKGKVIANVAPPPLRPREMEAPLIAKPYITQDLFFSGGRRRVSRYEGSQLAPGAEISGPAVIDELTSTLVLHADAQLAVTALDNYVVTIS